MNIVELVCALIGAVATILGGVWWIIHRAFDFGGIKTRFEHTEKTVDALPCTDHHELIQEHKNTLQDLREIVQSNNRLLVIISKWIMKTDESMIEELAIELNPFSVKHSPRRLTEMGENLFNKIDGNAFIEANKEALFQNIRDRKPLAALDVEKYAYLACKELVDTPAFNRLKDFVYNEPTWQLPNGTHYDITLSDVCFVLGLRLRDVYLAEVGL